MKDPTRAVNVRLETWENVLLHDLGGVCDIGDSRVGIRRRVIILDLERPIYSIYEEFFRSTKVKSSEMSARLGWGGGEGG